MFTVKMEKNISPGSMQYVLAHSVAVLVTLWLIYLLNMVSVVSCFPAVHPRVTHSGVAT
jgi:hypothetical protein